MFVAHEYLGRKKNYVNLSCFDYRQYLNVISTQEISDKCIYLSDVFIISENIKTSVHAFKTYVLLSKMNYVTR